MRPCPLPNSLLKNFFNHIALPFQLLPHLHSHKCVKRIGLRREKNQIEVEKVDLLRVGLGERNGIGVFFRGSGKVYKELLGVWLVGIEYSGFDLLVIEGSSSLRRFDCLKRKRNPEVFCCRWKLVDNMFLLRRQGQNQLENDSSKQDTKVNELRAAVGPLSGRRLLYCTDACLRRYLEARNWNVDKAKKMLEETLKWRATYKPEEIRWAEVAHEGETGKVSRANFHDRLGRTVLIMRPGMQNTTSAEDNIRHLVYLLENAILNLQEGQEQMSWLIDFTGLSMNTSISVKTARDIIHILQNHYPERLAIAFLYNPPRIFQAFWKAVRFFLDPKTVQKVKFVYPNNKDSVELMQSLFDLDNLPSEFGGKTSLMYDHEEFSRLMTEDDVKTAKFWGLDQKPFNPPKKGHAGAEVAPEPVSVETVGS
ncbi:hypothetical protein V8G54_005219 [Vigna mungo]|uniref:CRAL-TRIO domain-containing protein n=1 Tax=Vigna mungo TaxID=3915 RepID=A0AAQ3PK46_VIGMU